MKSKLIIIVVFLFFAFAAKAQKTIDKVVAIIGNEAILLSDIESGIISAKAEGFLIDENNPRCKMLENLMTNKLLVAQAKHDSLKVDLDNVDAEVEKKIKYFLLTFGNEKTVEQYLQRPMSKIRELLKANVTEDYYAQTMMHELTGKLSVTPQEVKRFYKSIPEDSIPQIPDQYVIYQIVKKPNSEQAVIAAKEQLIEIRKRILAGGNFSVLAGLYSDDRESAKRGGEVGLSSLEEKVPPIREAVKNLRQGAVSNIIETEYGFYIIQLIEKRPNDLVNYRCILIKPKYTQAERETGFRQLDSIARLIKSDSITFERAAIAFSDDEKSKMGNGLLVNIRGYAPSPYFKKDELNPDDFKALEHLPTKEISAPFETIDRLGNVTYKIIMVKTFVPTHTANLKDDYDLVSNFALQKKQGDVIANWVKQKQKTEYIRVDESFKSCDFEHEGWFK